MWARKAGKSAVLERSSGWTEREKINNIGKKPSACLCLPTDRQSRVSLWGYNIVCHSPPPQTKSAVTHSGALSIRLKTRIIMIIIRIHIHCGMSRVYTYELYCLILYYFIFFSLLVHTRAPIVGGAVVPHRRTYLFLFSFFSSSVSP